MFSTTDGGATWRVATAFGDRKVDAIAISDDISPRLFVLTSDSGVLKSSDGSWKPAGTLDDLVMALAILPGQPSALHAATADESVFRSVDGGATW